MPDQGQGVAVPVAAFEGPEPGSWPDPTYDEGRNWRITADAFIWHVDRLALRVAFVRRRLPEGDAWLADQMADYLEDIDADVWPTAGELVRAGRGVDEALRVVDARRARLCDLTGRTPL